MEGRVSTPATWKRSIIRAWFLHESALISLEMGRALCHKHIIRTYYCIANHARGFLADRIVVKLRSPISRLPPGRFLIIRQ